MPFGLIKPCTGAIPVLNEVMSAARGATYAFSGVTRHVNDSVSRTFSCYVFLYGEVYLFVCIQSSKVGNEWKEHLSAQASTGLLYFFSHLFSLRSWGLRTLKLALDVELASAMVLELVCHDMYV